MSLAAQIAPLADAGVADAVDGLIRPLHRRGREGLGVDVAGRGVEGEGDEAFAVAAASNSLPDETEPVKLQPCQIGVRAPRLNAHPTS
jgi:hypothetical protein